MIYLKGICIEDFQDKKFENKENKETSSIMIQFHGMNMSLEEIQNDIREIKKEIGESEGSLHLWEDPYDLFLFAQLINLEELSKNLEEEKDSFYEKFLKKPIMHFTILMATSLTCPPCLFSKRELQTGSPANWQSSLKEFKNRVLTSLIEIVKELKNLSEEKKYNIPMNIRNKFFEVYENIPEQEIFNEIAKVFDECFHAHMVFATYQELFGSHSRNQKYFPEYNLQILSKIKTLHFEYFPAFFKLLFDSQLIDRTMEYGNPISLTEYCNPQQGCPPLFMQNAFRDKLQGQKMTNLAHWIVERPESLIEDLYQREIKNNMNEIEQIKLQEQLNKQITILRHENKIKAKFMDNMAEYFFIRLVQELK